MIWAGIFKINEANTMAADTLAPCVDTWILVFSISGVSVA